MNELPESKYMFDIATYRLIGGETILLDGVDLSQLLQSLSDRIKALEPIPGPLPVEASEPPTVSEVN